MGHSASVHSAHVRETTASLFCREALKEASLRFVECCDERVAFAKFIKEGCWLDDICLNRNFTSDEKIIRTNTYKVKSTKLLDSCQLDNSNGGTDSLVLYDFIVPHKAYESMKVSMLQLIKEEQQNDDEGCALEESSKTATGTNSTNSSYRGSKKGSGKSSNDSSKSAYEQGRFDSVRLSGISEALWAAGGGSGSNLLEDHDFQGDYFDLEHSTTSTGFTRYQMLAILFTVLYPLYLRNSRCEESGKTSSKCCFMDREGYCMCAVPCKEPVSSPEACRAEELLLSAAAYFDEERMLRALALPAWLEQVPLAIEKCPLGISICDARAPIHGSAGYPILFVNKMLQKITGYSAHYFSGKSFSVLQGPGTEKEQIKLISSALAARRPIKIAITNYRKNGTTFLNMLVLKPVFNEQGVMCYVIGVSFDISRRDASLSELQQGDVILSLLPLILSSSSSTIENNTITKV